MDWLKKNWIPLLLVAAGGVWLYLVNGGGGKKEPATDSMAGARAAKEAKRTAMNGTLSPEQVADHAGKDDHN